MTVREMGWYMPLRFGEVGLVGLLVGVRTAAGFLGRLGVGRAVGAQEELGGARGDGAQESLAVPLGLEHRQAVHVRLQPALEER